MAELVSQAEFARRIGVSRQRVGALVRKGLLSLTKGKKLDYARALEALRKADDPAQDKARVLDPDRAGVAKSPAGTPSYGDAKTMREIYMARMAKLKYEEAKKSLVPARQVDDDAFEQARIVRDAMLAIPSRLRERLAAEDSPELCHQMLEAEIELALGALAGG
jgi:hypothetical protein